MYNLRRRLVLSSVIPLIFLLNFLYDYLTSRQSFNIYFPTPAAQTWFYFYFILDLFLIFITSFFFFSLEPLIQLFITDRESSESQNFKNNLKKLSLKSMFLQLEKFASKMEHRRLTHSIIFQLSLLVISYYAITSTNDRVGLGLALSLLLQTIVDQVFHLKNSESLKTWFWQINFSLNRNIEKIYVAMLAILFVVFLLIRL